MNRKEKIDILNLEVKEISDLLSGMSELSDADRIPKVIVEMAHAKAIRVLTGITELKSRMESGSAQVSETLSGRSESVSHPSSTQASSEPSASPTEESVKRGNEQPSTHRGGGTTTATTHSEPNSKPHVIFVSKRQLEEQATENRKIGRAHV